MSATVESSGGSWQRCNQTYTDALPVLDFPFKTLPDIYAPESTVIRLATGQRINAFVWCYLRTARAPNGSIRSIDITSLYEGRVQAMPEALERLSRDLVFKNLRGASARALLGSLGRLIAWSDNSQNEGRYRDLLSDPDIAFEALKGHHAYLRSRLQGHQLATSTAGQLDSQGIDCMSVIHDVDFRNRIEPITVRKGGEIRPPSSQDVGAFVSTLQAIFDSSAALITGEQMEQGKRTLRLSAGDSSASFQLQDRHGPLRLMELACVCFAGLVFADAGSNLAVLQGLEASDDLDEQLAVPDRINLKQKGVKFRAGGKHVEVHLSSTTVTRLRTFLSIRQRLVKALGGHDIAALFVQCGYENNLGEPSYVRAIPRDFLELLRKKIKVVGADLRSVTLRQLRAYKQQELVRTVPLPVAASLMGHTVSTAARAYCNATERTRQGEIATFMVSLQKFVESTRDTKPVLAGSCSQPDAPIPVDGSITLQPDCQTPEGCFFCEQFRVHADENDIRKLMSCRRVLTRLAPLASDTQRTQQVYTAVVDRIDALLVKLRQRQPTLYEAVRAAVEERGEMAPFWARKLQQLSVLGMLINTNQSGPSYA